MVMDERFKFVEHMVLAFVSLWEGIKCNQTLRFVKLCTNRVWLIGIYIENVQYVPSSKLLAIVVTSNLGSPILRTWVVANFDNLSISISFNRLDFWSVPMIELSMSFSVRALAPSDLLPSRTIFTESSNSIISLRPIRSSREIDLIFKQSNKSYSFRSQSLYNLETKVGRIDQLVSVSVGIVVGGTLVLVLVAMPIDTTDNNANDEKSIILIRLWKTKPN